MKFLGELDKKFSNKYIRYELFLYDVQAGVFQSISKLLNYDSKFAELSFALHVLQNIVVSQLQYTTQTLHASETVILTIYYL